MDCGRAEGRQAGVQKTAPGHGREPQADGLGGKQRQSEGGTLQEAGGKDDEGSVPQETCSGKEPPQKAGSGEGEVEGGSPLEEGQVEGGSPLDEGQVEGGPPLEGGTPQEGKVEGWSPLEEEGVPLPKGLDGGTPLEGLEEGPPLGKEWREDPHRQERRACLPWTVWRAGPIRQEQRPVPLWKEQGAGPLRQERRPVPLWKGQGAGPLRQERRTDHLKQVKRPVPLWKARSGLRNRTGLGDRSQCGC